MTVDELQTLEEFREAIAVLAAESVRQKEVIEAQGELLKEMDASIKTLVKLVDIHQAMLEKRKEPPPPQGFVH
jgi:hypothetical protein